MISNVLSCLIFISYVSAGLFFNPFDYAAYAPRLASCPLGPLVRSGTSLSSSETSWLQKRQAKTDPALISFLLQLNLDDFDASSFVSGATKPITIGLAFSGGGYRAMLAGAGQFAAYDSRTAGEDSTLKGLLQATTYIAGLSGGSWLVGTVAMNNFQSIDDIADSNLWKLDRSIIDPGFIDPFTNIPYYTGINSAILAKSLSLNEVTVADIWGRALSYQFLNGFTGDGAGLTFSSLATKGVFANADMPFPAISALTRAPNTGVINLNSVLIEFNPFEIGSFDPSLAAFAQLKYVGTALDGGKVQRFRSCVTGFDNAGFVMGTSSALFTAFYDLVNLSKLPALLQNIIHAAVVVPYQNLNVVLASWAPNPFYSSSSKGFLQSQKRLYLADGGIDGQNVPLQPLLNRNLDVIFAHDNSADVTGWPDGTAMIATYNRQFTSQGFGASKMPTVPDQNTFRNGNLTSRPAFFGCSANSTNTPLVVYLANRPFSYWSNTSSFKLTYSDSEKRGMIRNGYETVTRKNGTIDSNWNVCVGCAVINREQVRQGIPQSDQCKQCFKQYCWDGSIYSGPVNGQNFGDDSLVVDDLQYNSQNVGGINKGGASFLKRDEMTGDMEVEGSLLKRDEMSADMEMRLEASVFTRDVTDDVEMRIEASLMV